MLAYAPSIVALGLAAVVAAFLTRSRPSPAEHVEQRRAAATALAITLVVQAFHFGEEFLTGFHERLGPLFDLPDMPATVFVVFNVTWLVIWFIAIPGVSKGSAPAFFTAWFLAIAGVINGVAHPILAVASGGYFPGLATAIPIGLAAAWLLRRLSAASG